MGLTAVDLLTEKDWPMARDHGLICSMGSGFGGSIADGLNVKANHEKILAGLKRGIPLAAANKVPNLITFFGNRRGMGDAEASANCVEALNRVKGVAEEHGVTICVELLNSKVDHKDYQGDHTAFGVGIVKAVGSPRVKLLYDIYHMQIMEGDVIRTIRDNRERLRPLPHRRRARPPRARRHAGAQLADGRGGDRRHRLPGLLRPRVHSDARSADVAAGGRRALRRLARHQLASGGGGSGLSAGALSWRREPTCGCSGGMKNHSHEVVSPGDRGMTVASTCIGARSRGLMISDER